MLYVVRHGRTAANANRLLLGRADPPLDDVGEEQARRLAEALRPDVVVSSPLVRARQTAAAFGVDVDIDDRWIELDYGELDTMPLRDVPVDLWARWRSDPAFAPPGGESLVALSERVHGACRALLRAAVEGDVVVVTHVSPLKAAVAWALDAGPLLTWRLFVEPASITCIDAGGPAPVLRSFNETGHLA